MFNKSTNILIEAYKLCHNVLQQKRKLLKMLYMYTNISKRVQ